MLRRPPRFPRTDPRCPYTTRFRSGLDGEQAYNEFALHAAGKLGIPVVASNDVRFLAPEGFDAHEARVCIASGRVLDDTRRPRDYGKQRSEEHTSELQSLMRISYAGFCLKKKKKQKDQQTHQQ